MEMGTSAVIEYFGGLIFWCTNILGKLRNLFFLPSAESTKNEPFVTF